MFVYFHRIAVETSNRISATAAAAVIESERPNKIRQTIHRDANATADADSACLFHRAYYFDLKENDKKERKKNLPPNTMT